MLGSLDRNWNRRWADLLALEAASPFKNKKQRGIDGGSPPMPKLIISYGEKNINCLEDECSAYLLPMG